MPLKRVTSARATNARSVARVNSKRRWCPALTQSCELNPVESSPLMTCPVRRRPQGTRHFTCRPISSHVLGMTSVSASSRMVPR